ncbi:MAG: hypothetical protein AAB263_16860, partial [Planctomycetota bacterium]
MAFSTTQLALLVVNVLARAASPTVTVPPLVRLSAVVPPLEVEMRPSVFAPELFVIIAMAPDVLTTEAKVSTELVLVKLSPAPEPVVIVLPVVMAPPAVAVLVGQATEV